jgi:hypothetical protein
VRLRLQLVAAVALLLAACTTPPTPSSVSPRASVASTGGSPTPAGTPSDSPLISMPASGRPYDADDLLLAMRDSRRPGGVPDQVETDAIATALAEAIWTYDGAPYPLLVVGGSCGPSSCTVEASGSPAGAAGADLYAFSVTPASGAVELLAADLHGYPTGVDALLDQVARSALGAQLDGLAIAGASWLLPPESGRFRAAYRSGGEEASPGLDVVVDLVAGGVVGTSQP